MKFMNVSIHAAILAAVFAGTFATVSTANAQQTTRRRRTTTTTTTTTTAPATPADSTTTTTVAAPAAAPVSEVHHNFTFDAFIDPNARISSRNYLFNAGDLNGVRGFFIKDAALNMTGELSHQTKAVVELPFFSQPDTNQFAFAALYAQAYLQYTMANTPVAFKLGQYNSFFGLEANSSRDRFFTEESWVKKQITPWTHTGAQVSFATEGATKFSILGQVANQNSIGMMTSNDNVELGLQARIDAGMGYGALGFSYSKGQGYNEYRASDDDTNMLIELMGGLNMGSFNVGLQLDSKKTNGYSDSAFTAMLLGAFQATSDLAVGARVELLNNVAGNFLLPGDTTALVSTPIEVKSGYGIAVGPSYKLDTNLTVRGDLNYTSVKFDGADEKGYFGANFSVVATL